MNSAAMADGPVCPLRIPPRARPGLSGLPLVGRLLAGLATAKGPLEHALRCRAETGDVFTVDPPGAPPITYLLGTRGYRFMNRLPPEVAGIGSVLSIVPVLSQWISRSDSSPEVLEQLAIAGRGFLSQRLRRPEATTEIGTIVEETVEAATREWSGTIDLADALVDLVHRVSLRCVGGASAAARVGEGGLSCLRVMTAGVDVPRLALGGTVARYLMRDYWAARCFERLLRRVVSEHDEGCRVELIDDLRASMRVGDEPLDERDLPWALNYVLFNAVAYPGTYGFWSFVDMLSDPGAAEAIREATPEDAVRRAEHALLETIRRNPVTVAGRMLKKDVRYPAAAHPGAPEYVIPAGNMLGSAPGSFARDPAVYRDPDAYCPHRFAAGEPVPQLFGAGAFGCVAQRYVRALLPLVHTALLRRFRFELVDTLPPRKARPALHYPRRRVRAIVTPLAHAAMSRPS